MFRFLNGLYPKRFRQARDRRRTVHRTHGPRLRHADNAHAHAPGRQRGPRQRSRAARRDLWWPLIAILAATLVAAAGAGWLAARAHLKHDNERYGDLVRAVAGVQDLAQLSDADGATPRSGPPELLRRLSQLPGVRNAFLLRNGDISLWASDPTIMPPPLQPSEMLRAALGGEPSWRLGADSRSFAAAASDLFDGGWRAWRIDYLIPVLDTPARNVVAVVDLTRDAHSALLSMLRDVWPNTAVAAVSGIAVALMFALALTRLRRLHGLAQASSMAAEAGAVGAECATAVGARMREFIDSVRADASGAARGDRTFRRAQAQHIVDEVDRLERWTSEFCDYLDPDVDTCADAPTLVEQALRERGPRLDALEIEVTRAPVVRLPRLAIGSRLFYRLAEAALDGTLAAMPHGGRLSVGMRHLARHGMVEVEVAATGALVQGLRGEDGRWTAAPALVLTALRRIGGGLSVTRHRDGGFVMVLAVPSAGGRQAYRDVA